MITVIAYDYMNVPRCWADGPTKDIAETRCLELTATYKTRRPDLWVKGFRLVEEKPPSCLARS